MLRAAVTVAIVAAIVLGASAAGGPPAVVIAVLCLGLFALGTRLLAARFAHAMFESGRYVDARRYYQLLALVTLGRSRRGAARVSVAATYLAEGRYAEGARLLDAIDPARLDPPTRAGWHNNRAYAALRTGARGPAAEEALRIVRAALALYPDVPGLLHTEALALFALGRIDEAIRGFDTLWERGELPARLEAERCDDLALAWAARGEAAYADDYRRRAVRAVPDAPWRTATAELDPLPAIVTPE